MKRSRAVQAFLVISAASALSSCGQKHLAERRCVDENGSFTDDRNCMSSPVPGSPHHFAWVYAPEGATNKSSDESTPATENPKATTRGVIGGEGSVTGGGAGE
ncbi:MAG: hypothetical protein QOH67_5144 [Hyphomicrobiales bacterium]|jgi:hypothetical protein|nr:hypothetical protein [Bryobacterales bacterium]MEA2874775.1 hypothetical protein [Hyphomicrobiales bacterium]